MKMNKKSKEGIKRKIASFSLTALLLNVAMVGVFVSGGEVRAEDIVTNPVLPNSCGIDMVLIIDSSSSMYGTPLQQEKDAFKSFIDAFLPNTPTRIAIVDFNTTASLLQTYSNDAELLKTKIESIETTPGHPDVINYTNWHDALVKAYGESISVNSRVGKPDLFVFASDGNPNYYGDGVGYDATEALNQAITQANIIKSNDTRIITLGIGDGSVDSNKLQQISGSVVAPPANIDKNTDVILSDFSTLASKLADLANDMCGGTISVQKFVDNEAASGWGFEASIEDGISAQDFTDNDGYIVFDVNIDEGESSAVVDIAETLQSGFSFVSALCTDQSQYPVGTYTPGIETVTGITVGWDDVIYCRFDNMTATVPETGSITIIKDSQPNDYQEFAFSGDLGNFTLTDDGTNLTNSQSFTKSVEDYTITETEIDGWSLSNVECSIDNDNGGSYNWAGNGVDINLNQGEHIICTFTNTQDTLETGSITVCKYNDINKSGIIDEGDEIVENWTVYLDTDEKQTGPNGCITYSDLPLGDYIVTEEDRSNWNQILPESAQFDITLTENNLNQTVDFLNEEIEVAECINGDTKPCQYTGPDGTENIGICHAGEQTCTEGSWGECEGEITPQDEICGDGLDNDCDGSVDENCGGGGGGWTPPTVIKITDEKVSYLGDGKALVSWKTNVTTTNQVVYGDDLIETDNLGDAPEYDYDSVNEESSSMWKEHEVLITGLIDGITYYFRPVADRNGSAEVIGEEVSYVFEETPEEGEVKGVTDPPPPAECNYLLEYIKLGADNNPVEVEKLERFLNEFEGENLPINGIYEQIDFDAVSGFQEKYLESVLSPWSHNKATGYVYITTKKKINEIYCQRTFPLTAEQEAEVASFSERFLGMFTGSAEASDNSSEDSASGDTSESFETGDEEDVSGRVGGAKDEVDEGDGEDETIEETENGTEDKDETKKEDEKPEDKTDEGADITEDAKGENESEVAGIEYSEYLLWFAALVIIAGIAWYYWPKRKEGSE